MSVMAEQSKRMAALRAFLTIVIVTALVAGALGAATFVGSRLLVGMLPG
jgi:hypothetical protein